MDNDFISVPDIADILQHMGRMLVEHSRDVVARGKQ